MADRFGVPAIIDNDVNALALAEWLFVERQAVESLVVLALGTGAGAGIVLEGRLVRGAAGYGAELGHTPVNFHGPACWCGGRGCLAVYASGRGIAESARARIKDQPDSMLVTEAALDRSRISPPLVFRCADRGDPVASAIVGEAVQALGAMIGIVVNGLNPEVLVITGGVATSLVPLEAKLRRAAGEYAFATALARTRIRIDPGDKRLTVRGGAALVCYEMARRRPRRRR